MNSSIESFLLDVDSRTLAEIVVYVVDSLWVHGIEKDGSEINEIVSLGVYVFNELSLEVPGGFVVGIGKADLDNGVLVAIEDRKWRIEVGYGFEGYIIDIESNKITQDYLVPKFQQGEYGESLALTVEALSLLMPEVVEPNSLPLRGRYVYGTGALTEDDEIPTWIIIIIVIFVIFFFISVGGRSSGRGGSRGYWGGFRRRWWFWWRRLWRWLVNNFKV